MDDPHPIRNKDVLANMGNDHPARKKRKITLWILAGAILLALVIFNPISQTLISAFLGMGYIRGVEAKIQKPEVYEPVAVRLAMYCQSDQSLFPQYLGEGGVPDEFVKVIHGYCTVTTNGASVEMGGGFYHFGYQLELDQSALTPTTNVWQLYLYREDSQPNTNLLILA